MLLAETMTFQEHVEYMHRSGFRWDRTDRPVVSLETALLALAMLDEKITASGVYGVTLIDCIAARDDLQAAICKATECS